MSVVKRAMLLLLLAAIGTNAAPEDCDGLNKTLPTADLHKVSLLVVRLVPETRRPAVLRGTVTAHSAVYNQQSDVSKTYLIQENIRMILFYTVSHFSTELFVCTKVLKFSLRKMEHERYCFHNCYKYITQQK